MKYIKILIILLFVSCSSTKQSNNREIVELFVFDIKEQSSSYVLKTINNSLDTTFVVIAKNDFDKLRKTIVKDQTYTFEVVKIKFRVPHMQELMYIEPPYIIFDKDTICQSVNWKECPITYSFINLK